MRQVQFRDLENNDILGGIMLDNGDVICGCCGGVFSADEEGKTFEILKFYSWLDISDSIMGE